MHTLAQAGKKKSFRFVGHAGVTFPATGALRWMVHDIDCLGDKATPEQFSPGRIQHTLFSGPRLDAQSLWGATPLARLQHQCTTGLVFITPAAEACLRGLTQAGKPTFTISTDSAAPPGDGAWDAGIKWIGYGPLHNAEG